MRRTKALIVKIQVYTTAADKLHCTIRTVQKRRHGRFPAVKSYQISFTQEQIDLHIARRSRGLAQAFLQGTSVHPQ
jgi:hypothetical protein